ncbi:MAG: flagellin [Desulfarculus sp.]|nr:flagellin [Desulfarculus sp.]
MRADIAVINQGIRNASDAISMIQTAEGAMSVIDEKLIRMKELAEQAATGTYTTAQRAIMDSEYQAMAAEIDRIANATDFNGVKLLDGSLTGLHSGSGMKIHFGAGNAAAEDYYYVNIGDMRATEASGLRVGTSDTNDIFRTTAMGASTPTTALGGTSGIFGIQYTTDGGTTWNTYGYVNVTAGTDTLTTVMDQINQGAAQTATISMGSQAFSSSAVYSQSLTIGNFVFSFSSGGQADTTFNAATGTGVIGTSINGGGWTGSTVLKDITFLINSNIADFQMYAGEDIRNYTTSATSQIVLIDANLGSSTNIVVASTLTSVTMPSAGKFTGGGGTQVRASLYHDPVNENYQLQLTDASKGNAYQMRIVTTFGTILGPGTADTGTQEALFIIDMTGNIVPNYSLVNQTSEWSQTQNASGNTNWNGKDILTQSGAQLALAQLDTAINTKDGGRANLGALQNRLQNTITNLQIQAENLQAAESRISDVDVATEMTMFTRNNIMAQAGVAMLAQANSLPQLALQLLQG